MGFFSWKTSDTKKSIRNIHTGKCRPVFLLQPNGKAPIGEPAYEGYGEFGGKDAYAWFAVHNLPAPVLEKLSEDGRREAGISILCGTLLHLHATDQLFTVFHNHGFLKDCGIDIVEHDGRWSDPIPSIGKSPNQLLDDGAATKVQIRTLLPIFFPLKFSFKENARYEDLPEAETCPDQGFF